MELTNSPTEAYFFAAVLESAPDSAPVTECNGAICWVNTAFCALNGYGRPEVIGANLRWLKSGYQEAVFYQDLWNTILSGRTWRGEITNRRKDGMLYKQELWINPVQDHHQVITHMNLIVNARDAMPGGGKISIETSNVDPCWEERGISIHLCSMFRSF